MKKFVCSVCGYVHEGDSAPEQCPVCKAPAEKFKEQFFKYHFSSATSEKKEEGRPLMKIFNYPKGHTHKKNYKSTI